MSQRPRSPVPEPTVVEFRGPAIKRPNYRVEDDTASAKNDRVDPVAATTVEPPSGELLADTRYASIARQQHLYIALAFSKLNPQPGCCFASQGWLAKRLRISLQRVQINQGRLATLGLIKVDANSGANRVNRVYPLPHQPGSRRSRRKEAVAKALRCRKLVLRYRVQWALEEASWHGEPVRRSLAELADQTIAPRQLVWRAIQRNIGLGKVRVRALGAGRNRVCEYTIIGTLVATEALTLDDADLSVFDRDSAFAFYDRLFADGRPGQKGKRR